MTRIAIIIALVSLSACSSAVGPQPVNKPAAGTQTPAQAPGGGASSPHATPGSSEASSNAPSAPLDEKVAQLQAAYDKNPSDAKAKTELASAVFENAQFYMYKSPLPPNQKYPKALALYRQTLELDPSKTEARDSIEMIESIYRSMGKEVPHA